MAARNIKLAGPEWEPMDDAWRDATPAGRRAYWTRLAELALFLKRREIVRGIGIDGAKLQPVKPRSRPDGATGAPLDPHGTDSRSHRLLAAHVTDKGVTLFWRAHGRQSWAKILGYHADGAGNLPVRNILGFSPANERKLRRDMRDWWETRQKQKARAKAKRKPAVPKPPAPPRPVVPAHPRVVYLPRGASPNPLSRKIQVYED